MKRIYQSDYQVKTAIMTPEGLFREPEMQQAVKIAFSKASFPERIAAIENHI